MSVERFVPWSSPGLACSNEVPRHRLEFLLDGSVWVVVFGWDPFGGFFAELRASDRRRPVAEYSALQAGYRQDAPLQGLLEWLVQVGVLDANGLEEALLAWASPEPVRLSRAGRVALDVIETLKREAD